MATVPSRNIVDPETAESNRTVRLPGGYTFHAPIPDGYDGDALVFAAVRLGDHAHVDVESGRVLAALEGERRHAQHRGYAGHLILRWPEWLLLRAILDADPRVHIAEAENPTLGQLEFHSGGRGKRRDDRHDRPELIP